MVACPRCGEENPERAKFSLNCANPLGPAAPPAGEDRKTVSVLFADVVSSTSRGEQTDPESTRRMLGRYFEAMKRVLERHGGTVEKFIGDAVMAVFGIIAGWVTDESACRAAADTVTCRHRTEDVAMRQWESPLPASTSTASATARS